MKRHQTLALLSASFLLFACSSTVRLDDLPPVDSKNSASSNNAPATSNQTANADSGKNTAQVREVDLTPKTSTTTATSATVDISKRSIYFDFDSYTIRDDFKQTLQNHAKHLASNRQQKIVLEGNTDEVGGREYNLALGQKRAEAVLQTLKVLGVTDTQMEAVSFGKEKPRAAGSTDAAAQENRRTDIRYK